MITERQKFRNWLKCQMNDHGLVDVKVCLREDPFGEDLNAENLRFGDVAEEVCRDLNKLNAAIARGDVRPLRGI